MTKYVALLRGIAPGNPSTSNPSLVAGLEALGLKNVKSVISSGNVVFESDLAAGKLETIIEATWPKKLGFTATTVVRSQAQLRKLLNANLFKDKHSAGTYQLITFFKRPTKPGFNLPYQPPNKPYKLVGYVDNALFSVTDTTGQKAPNIMTWLEQQYGKDITSRTPLTVERILGRMGE
jgi:uncharacterized protein (DUF1697 family)